MPWDTVVSVDQFEQSMPLRRLIHFSGVRNVMTDISFPGCKSSFVIVEALCGEASFSCRSGQRTLSPGEALLTHSGTAFKLSDFSPDSKICLVLFTGDVFTKVEANLALSYREPVWSLGTSPLEKLSKEISRRCQNRKHLYAQELRHFLLEIVCQVLPAVSQSPFLHLSKSDHVLYRAMALIEENLKNATTLPELAEDVSISYSHLRTLFRDCFGISMKQYQRLSRIDLACQTLALHQTRSVKETAIELGYADPQYFSRIVKKHTGLAPAGWQAVVPTFTPLTTGSTLWNIDPSSRALSDSSPCRWCDSRGKQTCSF